MARLIGYMANRRDRMRGAFRQERDAITGTPGERRAWGIGFYQGDEILHKKQPTADGEPVDWDAVTKDVQTDCAIAHVRHATVGGFSVNNTHPFRMRQWVFAHVGTLASFEVTGERLQKGLPDFIARNVRGTSDSELYFHLLLSALHDRNALEATEPRAEDVAAAIASVIDTIDSTAGAEAEDDDEGGLNMILTNGRQSYALRRGGPLGYVEQSGLREPTENEGPTPGSPLLRYVMVVSGDENMPERYTQVDQRGLVIIDRELAVQTLPL